MTKLYNGKGKRVHPSLPAAAPWDFLATLPAAVLTLAAALSPEEREVLAYLLSDEGTGLVGPERGTGKKKPLSLSTSGGRVIRQSLDAGASAVTRVTGPDGTPLPTDISSTTSSMRSRSPSKRNASLPATAVAAVPARKTLPERPIPLSSLRRLS
ncbi:hypothetical protein HPP92_004750 [Vanilla planifolia]|uniref:Uncharacterized protein n=1 Tax=Vanilla planifolia TaxID=51239 RepID=A0A835RSP9_VANPL|nr:hypothetical protein HPP92_004750 [Vanilla planifolia]